jgi:hypothetical protein
MTRNLLWALLGIFAIIAFDRMMRLDAARLCSNDATAYKECSR